MKLLIQRVASASIRVDGKTIASIGNGVVAMVGFEPLDTFQDINKLTRKFLNYKIFLNSEEKIALSIIEENADILLVPQVTLSIRTNKGMKPSFSQAADHQTGLSLFNSFKNLLLDEYQEVQSGIFGENMSIQLVNEGPITFWFES